MDGWNECLLLVDASRDTPVNLIECLAYVSPHLATVSVLVNGTISINILQCLTGP